MATQSYTRRPDMAGSKLTVEFDDGDVHCDFDWQATTMFEKCLDMDTLAYLGAQKSKTFFLEEALFCGSVKNDRNMTPKKAARKLQHYQGELDDLQKEILYAIARGKPEKEALRMVNALDDAFDSVEGEFPTNEPPAERPTSAGSGTIGGTTSESPKQPPSA